MLEISWQFRRGGFNHQWLANNYLNQLRYWVSEMECGGDDPLFESGFLNDTLKQWCHRSNEAQWIVENAAEALSPSRLFGEVPLNRIPADIREPVAEACHLLWLGRTSAPRQRAELAKINVDSAFEKLMSCLKGCRVPLTQKSTKNCLPLALEFEAACKELNKALEELPKIEYW